MHPNTISTQSNSDNYKQNNTMQSHNSPREQCISALKERGITYKREAIDAVFDSASKTSQENEQWVIDHLGSETLLSREEIALIDKLESSGTFQNLLRQSDLSTIRPLTEEDIRTATAALKTSTAAIQRQTAVLKSQNELVQKYLSRENDSERDQHHELSDLSRRYKLETQRVTAVADELKNDIQSRVVTQKEQALVEKRQLILSVTAKLKDDDMILLKAENFASELESTEGDQRLKKRAAELTSTLSRLVSEEAYCRLDRLYLETSEASVNKADEVAEIEGIIVGLEQDLESLYSEIEVLAEMSARQQFGERILNEIQRNRDRLNSTLEEKLDLILHLITDMTLLASHMTEQLLYRQSCCEALDVLLTVYEIEMRTKPTATQKISRRTSTLGSAGLSPSIGWIEKGKSASMPQLRALESFLRRLGISGGFDDGSSDRQRPLGSFCEKRSRMIELLRNLSTAADMTLTEYLHPTDKAKELLSSAFQADSRFELTLADASQRERLTDLERQLGLVQNGIEGINLDAFGQRDKSQEKFTERWR